MQSPSRLLSSNTRLVRNASRYCSCSDHCSNGAKDCLKNQIARKWDFHETAWPNITSSTYQPGVACNDPHDCWAAEAGYCRRRGEGQWSSEVHISGLNTLLHIVWPNSVVNIKKLARISKFAHHTLNNINLHWSINCTRFRREPQSIKTQSAQSKSRRSSYHTFSYVESYEIQENHIRGGQKVRIKIGVLFCSYP